MCNIMVVLYIQCNNYNLGSFGEYYCNYIGPNIQDIITYKARKKVALLFQYETINLK